MPSAVATHVVINGKLYSPRFRATPVNQKPSHLQFKVSYKTSTATQKASIELQIYALCPPKEGFNIIENTSQYQGNLLFPIEGIINYSYATPSTIENVDRAFRILPNQDLISIRCLNFGAKIVIIEAGLGGIVPLHIEQMEVDLARLINTAKIVNAIPNAILEVNCLIPIADNTTDFAIAAVERVLLPTVQPLLISPGKQIPADPPTEHLTMDNRMSINKPNHEVKSGSTSTTSSSKDTKYSLAESLSFCNASSSPPVKPTHVQPGDESFSDPRPGKLWIESDNPLAGGNAVQDNNLLKQAPGKKEKAPGFNCQTVGHRRDECAEQNKNRSESGDLTKEIGLLKIESEGEGGKGISGRVQNHKD